MHDTNSLDLAQLVELAVPYLDLKLFLPYGPPITAGIGTALGLQYASWSLGRRKVRDARFDTGPNGLSTYYDLLRLALVGFFKWLLYTAAAVLVIERLRRWVDLRLPFAEAIQIYAVCGLAFFALVAGFCLGRALSHAGHWLVLELRGMRYATRNGQRYRVRFIHKSGAVTIDNTPWDARIQAEQERLAQNDSELHEQLKALLVALFPAAMWAIMIACTARWAAGVQGPGLTSEILHNVSDAVAHYRLDIVVPVILAVQRVPAPFAGLLVAMMDRLAYVSGAQFASLVQVREAADTRIDLQDVMGQKATGDAGFAKRSGRR